MTTTTILMISRTTTLHKDGTAISKKRLPWMANKHEDKQKMENTRIQLRLVPEPLASYTACTLHT